MNMSFFFFLLCFVCYFLTCVCVCMYEKEEKRKDAE